MDECRTKIRWTWDYFQKLVFELQWELWNYYVNPFPVFLFSGLLGEFGAKSIQTQVRSPWQNGVVETFHLSLKSEVLDRVVLHDAGRVHELCASYQSLYNKLRTQQGIAGQIPSGQKSDPHKIVDIGEIRIKKVKALDGLVTHFRIAA